MLKNINDVIDFATNQVAEKLAAVPQNRVVAGIASDANTKITMKTHHHYTAPTEQFFSGIWQSSVGAKNVSYTEEEICVILKVRTGFKSTWETIEPIKNLCHLASQIIFYPTNKFLVRALNFIEQPVKNLISHWCTRRQA